MTITLYTNNKKNAHQTMTYYNCKMPPHLKELTCEQNCTILEWVAISSPRHLPYSGIKPRSPTLHADSLPSEPPGKLL